MKDANLISVSVPANRLENIKPQTVALIPAIMNYNVDRIYFG